MPLDEAGRNGCAVVVSMLRRYGAVDGHEKTGADEPLPGVLTCWRSAPADSRIVPG